MQNLQEMPMQGQSSEAPTPQPKPLAPQPQKPAEPLMQPAAKDESEGGAARAGEAALEEKLASAEAKTAQLEDAFLRAKAELENYRRRAQEDIARAHKFSIEVFAEALLPVKDSLESALMVEAPSVESLQEGVEMTLKQLQAAFEKNRLEEINPLPGDKLDPARHHAISMVPADQDANTIIYVLQKGYMLADRLLRPALVTVAQGKAGADGA